MRKLLMLKQLLLGFRGVNQLQRMHLRFLRFLKKVHHLPSLSPAPSKSAEGDAQIGDEEVQLSPRSL